MSLSEVPVKREDIPREVLAWLRSLQLPRALRHPKRDLSNGFMVALICSRYWSNISMHSYEDKMSAANKRRNWNMLKKQFALNKCLLSDAMIDGMIFCRDNYAIIFLKQLFTLLTGRAIIEAAPLPAEEVAPSQTFQLTSTAPKSSATINVEFAPFLNNSTKTASRVRELSLSNIAKLKNLRSTPPLDLPEEHVVRVIPSEDGAEETGKDKDAKALLGFSVSVRCCDAQKTVVRDAYKASSVESFSSEREKRAQLDELQTITANSKALDIIEATVRSYFGRQELSGLRDGPMAYTDYFLRMEESLGSLQQCRVWSALHLALDDLTDCIFRHGASISDVVGIFIQPLKLQPKKQDHQRDQDSSPEHKSTTRLSKLSSSSDLRLRRDLSRKPALTQRFVFLVALLSNISEADPFLAVAMYCNDVLPHCVPAMSALDYVGAENYASLLAAALPLDRKLAARFLHDVLLAVYNALTVSGGSIARSSFYLLLHAVLCQLARGKSCSHAQASRDSSDSTDAVRLADEDLLLQAAYAITEYHVVAALSHESSRVRLVGAYLAEALVSFGCPFSSLFDDVLPLMSTCCASSSVLFKCVCATWMWAIFRRVNLFHKKSSATCLEKEAINEETVDKLFRHALPHFDRITCVLCDSLLVPGPVKTKVFIAQHLALCLDNIPAKEGTQRLCDHNKMIASIYSILYTAPQELVASFMSPTPLPEGCFRSGKLSVMKHTAMPLSVSSPFLGPLFVNGSLSDCYPLAPSEAVLIVFSPDGTMATPPSMEDERTGRKSAGSSGGRTQRGGSGGGGARLPITPGHILGKATLLLKDSNASAGVLRRVTWLYKIIVAGRANFDFLDRPVSLSEAAATQRWNAVMNQMYYDIASLTTAAEMLCTQKGHTASGAALNSITPTAGMAQQLVLQWYTVFGKGIGPKSGLDKSFRSANQITKAMEWYNETFAGAMESGKTKL